MKGMATMIHHSLRSHANPTAARYCTAIAVSLVLLCAARSSAASELFTPRHVAQLKTVVSAEVAPAGAHVAYALVVPRQPLKDENGPAWVELHVVDTDGNSRPFVTGKVNVSGVQWTPDGKGIAFVAKRGDVDSFPSSWPGYRRPTSRRGPRGDPSGIGRSANPRHPIPSPSWICSP